MRKLEFVNNVIKHIILKKSIKFCSKECAYKRTRDIRNKKKRDLARIKRGLPLDHPRLIKENGKGHYCTSRGYIFISRKNHPNARNKNGSIYEHVFCDVSTFRKIPPEKAETVHHKNGD